MKRCRVMNSKKMPLFLTFTLNQNHQIRHLIGSDATNNDDNFVLLVKSGDDIQKDQLIVNIIRLVGMLLEEKGYTNYFQYYACLSTGKSEGLIEIVQDSVTIGDIYNDQNNIENSLMHSEAEKHSIQNKVNTAKRVLLHDFAIQEYLITNSSLSNQSLIVQRKAMEDIHRLQAPRVLKQSNSTDTGSNSIEEMNKRFACSLGQYHHQ